MRQVLLSLIKAVKAGDLKSIKEIMTSITDTKEREDILSTHAQGNVIIKRPCGESEIQIWNPTIIMLAVTEWYPTIVEYFASFEVGSW